jgi:hypothetical protein
MLDTIMIHTIKRSDNFTYDKIEIYAVIYIIASIF